MPSSMSQIIGVIDEAVAPSASDNLDINIQSKSLINVIFATSTPVTLGIHGDWGGDKTSLINSILYAFDSVERDKQI